MFEKKFDKEMDEEADTGTFFTFALMVSAKGTDPPHTQSA